MIKMNIYQKLLTILLFVSFDCFANYDLVKTSNNEYLLVYEKDTIGTFLADSLPLAETADMIIEIEPGIFEWIRTVTPNKGEIILDAHLTMDFEANFKSDFSMIPSVSYDGNKWDQTIAPKGFTKSGEPWSFPYHRSSVPGATYTENEAWTVALFGKSEHLDIGFSCSLLPDSNSTVHRLTWPEEELPESYVSKRNPFYIQGYRKTLEIDKPYTMTCYLVVDKKRPREVGYQKMLDFAWKINYKPTQPWYNPLKLWDMGITYIKESSWRDDRSMFQVAMRYDGEDGFIKTGGFQLGWAGANGSASVSLIHNYLKTGNEEDLEFAVRCLDTWASRQLENGLIDVASEIQWYSSQDIANQAQGAESFFNAYILLKENGIEKPNYRNVALKICDFMVDVQKPSGQLGRSWDNDGNYVEKDGSIGSFMIRPLVMAYEITNREIYLEAARKCFDFYYREFMEQGFATAGAIDIYTIDKEGAVGIFEGAIKLYELLRLPEYLHKAKQVAYYLSTWQYHHSVVFPENTPLSKLKYETFGGTSVATVHACMDGYAVKYFYDLVKLANFTGEKIWKQRAIAIWNNSTIGISDGSLVILELPPMPVGAQSETYFQTNWGTIVQNRYKPNTINELNPFGYLSNWFVIWPTAYRLEALHQLKDWEIFNIKTTDVE